MSLPTSLLTYLQKWR